MEVQPSSMRAEVDTSRPFRSVREAVAVFGERMLVGDAHSQKTNAVTTNQIYSAPQKTNAVPKPIYVVATPKPPYSTCSSPPSFSSSSSHFNQDREEELLITSYIRKLEAELEETKQELKLLKERESEREVVLASLNAELHKNMTKMAEIEEHTAMAWGDERAGFQYLPSLAEALNLGEMDAKFGGKEKIKALKRKPIVPLVGDIFFRKKSSSSADFDNSVYSYSIH